MKNQDAYILLKASGACRESLEEARGKDLRTFIQDCTNTAWLQWGAWKFNQYLNPNGTPLLSYDEYQELKERLEEQYKRNVDAAELRYELGQCTFHEYKTVEYDEWWNIRRGLQKFFLDLLED